MAFSNWSSSKKGFSLLLSGTVGAQLILLLSVPILSRLFTPQDFGLFTLITSVSSIIIPLATLRLESAAMLTSEQIRASALVLASLGSIFLISGLSIFILDYLASTDLIDSLDAENLGIWVGIFVFTNSLFVLMSQIALREMQYGQVAKRTLTRSIAVSITQVTLGLWKIAPNGLLIGGAAGQLVGLIPIVKIARPYFQISSLRLCGSVLREYWRFPLVFTPSALLNSFGLYGPVIFFTLVYGADQGGQLSMAERVISLPLAFVGVVIGQVIDAEAAKVIRQKTKGLLRTFLRFSALLSALGISIIAGGAILGPIVLPWVLGPSWEQAGTYVQILSISAGLRLLSSPLSKFLIILQKSLLNTGLDIIRVALVGGSMITIINNNFSAETAAWLLYSSLATTYVIAWLATHRSVKRYEESV